MILLACGLGLTVVGVAISFLFIDREWSMAVAAVSVIVGLGLMIVAVAKSDRAYDQRCHEQGGYVKRGRSIELCIDPDGRIIPLGQEVERGDTSHDIP